MAEKCNTFVFESPQPRVSIVPPRSKPGFVFSPGTPGPAGRDLQIDGTAENYAALQAVTPVRVGELWQVLNTGALYTWTTSGWPAEDQGRLLRGPQGETGRGISALSIDGDDLVASMTRGPVERVQVPSITASAESAAAAASAAALAREFRDETQGLVDSIPDLGGAPESHTHVSADITDAQHGILSNVIIRRDENGMFTVADPVEDTHPVSKAWAVAQIAAAMNDATGMTPEQVQMLQDLAAQLADGEDMLGTIMQQLDFKLNKTSAVYSRDAGASVVRRNESGQIAVPSAPDSAEQATSMQWVETHVDSIDAANRTWTSAQVDALATLVDEQAGQITALQGTVASLQTELSDHKAEAVVSSNIRRVTQSDDTPENAPEDEITFVRRGDRV